MYVSVFLVMVHAEDVGVVPHSVWDNEPDANDACAELVMQGESAALLKLPVQNNMSEKDGHYIH